MSDSNKDTLTDEEIEAYVLEYKIFADKSKKVREFLNQKGLTCKDTTYRNFTGLPPKAMHIFNILYVIKCEVQHGSK